MTGFLQTTNRAGRQVTLRRSAIVAIHWKEGDEVKPPVILLSGGHAITISEEVNFGAILEWWVSE